ncbi:MAG: RNA polymerase subunit sigma-70 [Evtepia sp.]
MAAKEKRKEIRQDLLDQLERGGTTGGYYRDLVADYMDLWDTKNRFMADIKERGAKVLVVTASGSENMKTNDSVTDLIKVNAQMLKILDSIGIKPAQGASGEEEDL